MRATNGRWARFYFLGSGDPMAVTYHKHVAGRLRQLKLSEKLMRKVLRAR